MKSPHQSTTTLDQLAQTVWQHLVERDWQDEPSRSLAISIALEAAELLEHYQWQDEPVGNNEAVAEELADIFIYAFHFAMKNDIDIAEAIQHKLDRAARKRPAINFKGKTADERAAAWVDAKKKAP